MKTTTLAFLLLLSSSVLANHEKYVEAMKKNIETVYKASTMEELQSAINAFNRIGDAEKTKWEPFYYASFGNIMLATRESDAGRKDVLLDLARIALDKANAIQPNESEVVALEGFIHMIRVTVDPATRGPQYSMMSMQAFGKALAINPANPRALGLMAQMQYGTAQFFKQAPTEACESARKAWQLFSNEQSTDVLAPAWGKGMVESMMANCK